MCPLALGFGHWVEGGGPAALAPGNPVPSLEQHHPRRLRAELSPAQGLEIPGQMPTALSHQCQPYAAQPTATSSLPEMGLADLATHSAWARRVWQLDW